LAFLKKNNVPTTRDIFGAGFCRPIRGLPVVDRHPRLAPWAAFLRRFAAGFPTGFRTRTNATLGDSSTRFPGNKKRPGRNPDSLLETHSHDRRTIVT
jgi:hypothetical protein